MLQVGSVSRDQGLLMEKPQKLLGRRVVHEEIPEQHGHTEV